MSTPLTRSRAAALPLSSPESNPTGAIASLAPSSPVMSSTAAIAPAVEAPPVQSSATSQEKPKRKLRPAKKAGAPPAQLGFPFPHQRHYACGPKLCELCSKDRPPIGHKTPISDFVVSTIIRHAMPHSFETLEQVKEREVAMGLKKPSKGRKAAEGDDGDDGDFEYGPTGEFKPPAWTSEKARPKKSCLRKRESTRFAPYPSPSTRTPLVRRSSEDIKASLDEAFANRILLNYEGPNAITIRNEISAIHIPGEEPFKWDPEYTGPPSETSNDIGQPLSEKSTNTEGPRNVLASSPPKALKGNIAVVEPPLPGPRKKRRYVEDNNDATSTESTAKTTEESPTKRMRTTRKILNIKSPGFAAPPSTHPLSSSPEPLTTPCPPTHSSTSPISSSGILTPVASDSSSSDGEHFSSTSSDSDCHSLSPRKLRVIKKKLRFQFTDPSSTHPKFGIPDSLYLHYRRASSYSKKVRSTKKSKTYIPVTGEWTDSEIEWASLSKGEWDQMRKASLQRKTSREVLEDQIKRSEATDASAERFQRLVGRYEAGWPAIDLAGVRARHIRPTENEVPREKNKEAMPVLAHLDTMRKHYPSWDHPAWEEVDEKAIIEWKKSHHHELRVFDLMVLVADEESERRRANAEPEDATDVATVVDEDEARMRREYLAAEGEEVEAPSVAEPGSVWGATAPGNGDLQGRMVLSAGEFDGF